MSFIAMNRFKVALGREAEFEQIWQERERRLAEMDGYVSFSMLKGPEKDDYRLYASHTVWDSKEQFVAWTKSEQFRTTHKNAGRGRSEGIMAGHPEFEGFDVIIHEGK